MPANSIFQGEEDCILRIQTGQDLTGFTKMILRVRKPDDTCVVWPAYPWDRGEILHDIVAGDIDQVGQYEVQPVVEFGKIVRIGPKTSFQVLEDV